MHVCWGDSSKHTQNIDKGMIPVIEKGEYVRIGENTCYYYPMETRRAMTAQSEAESRSRMATAHEEGDASLEDDPLAKKALAQM